MEASTMLSCSKSRSFVLESSFYGNQVRSSECSQAAGIGQQHKRAVLRIEANKRRMPRSMMQQVYKQRQQQQIPRMPKPEDDNPRFVIFIRSKQLPLWYPLNIVSGGNAAKFLVGIVKNQFGKWIYGDGLTRNIAAAVYKDDESIIFTVKKKFAMLKDAKDFEFGYKIVDESKPDDALKPLSVIVIPPKEEIMKPITAKVTDIVGKGVESIKESLGLKEADEEQKKT